MPDQPRPVAGMANPYPDGLVRATTGAHATSADAYPVVICPRELWDLIGRKAQWIADKAADEPQAVNRAEDILEAMQLEGEQDATKEA